MEAKDQLIESRTLRGQFRPKQCFGQAPCRQCRQQACLLLSRTTRSASPLTTQLFELLLLLLFRSDLLLYGWAKTMNVAAGKLAETETGLLTLSAHIAAFDWKS